MAVNISRPSLYYTLLEKHGEELPTVGKFPTIKLDEALLRAFREIPTREFQ